MRKIALLREPTDGERVLALPPWIAPARSGRYWHVPRKASIFGGDRLAVSCWCGVSFHTVERWRLRDVPPPELRCGTCVGRAAGNARTDGLIFRPFDHFALPARCPGDVDAADHRFCFACGAKVGAARGPYASGQAIHRPAPELAIRCRPCPRHGWAHVRSRGGRLVCGRWVGGRERDCDFDCGPLDG